MAKLEEVTRGSVVKGILSKNDVTVVDVKWIGSSAIELTYKDAQGDLGSQLVYRDNEPMLEIASDGLPWSFTGDGNLFRLASEAYRINLAYLFDPILAVHTSLVEPLPHQITGVYEKMLPQHPLRYLLADDPGSGKTIMTGLLIKELIARGDLQRCLIVSPGNLAEQWQDELLSRFHLPFQIMTNDSLEASLSGNWFAETNMAICRLDKLSRNIEIQEKLAATDWDLIVCDEAHKMSAHFFGGEIKYTKRYKLGQMISGLTRHFLLLTATPHNGKEEDFQLFMALLDGDRFEGRFRDGVHTTDISDLMRRMVKEQLFRFDGTPLFPERIAHTVPYRLSDDEATLYKGVTEYVREEFNRADSLENDGRKGTIGFALTVLQRRLASSPEAIYRSLQRRRERLESRLRDEKLLARGTPASIDYLTGFPSLAAPEDLDDFDDYPEAEVEKIEEEIVEKASASRTITELEAEIQILRKLEDFALRVRQSGSDKKWEELSSLIQTCTEMFDANNKRRKLIIFSEHKDTLNYLAERIRGLLGRSEAVVTIHGSMGREQRKNAEQSFTQDKEVLVLVATDAAGEGINLQRANLMVNYDLPWNPNRLEQRFGRIHRIGQTEVCHLWNLVASETREGDVYERLLKKLEQERQALGGRVFDVLGRVHFEDRPLRDLLIESIRYGDQPEVRERLYRVIDTALDKEHLQELLEDKALVQDSMDTSQVRRIREDMERAEARRLQPHFVESFFLDAFRLMGGAIREREPRRYEITRVPSEIRTRDRAIGTRESVLQCYERVTFEKDLISVPGKSVASFLCPGHPLLDAVIDIILERYRDLLKLGAILVDEQNLTDEPRALVFLNHAIQDARTGPSGRRQIISRQLQFVEIDETGAIRSAGYAPYLDYRPLKPEETERLPAIMEALPWRGGELEKQALDFAVEKLVPRHLKEIRTNRESLTRKVEAAVKDRLTKEIAYWDHRAEALREHEQAGKINARMNSELARRRVNEMTARLQKRLADLDLERKISAVPPMVIGAALVIPERLLRGAERVAQDLKPGTFGKDRLLVELLAMSAVMEMERSLGYDPRDISSQNRGYDIESAIPGTGKLRFIEVKGRVAGATSVTVTKNEILTALNKPDDFILAIVEIDGEKATPRYVHKPFGKEPDFGVTSVNYRISQLLGNEGSD